MQRCRQEWSQRLKSSLTIAFENVVMRQLKRDKASMQLCIRESCENCFSALKEIMRSIYRIRLHSTGQLVETDAISVICPASLFSY